MNAITQRLREPASHRIDRQAAYFRRLAELNLRAAELAAERLERAHATFMTTTEDPEPDLELDADDLPQAKAPHTPAHAATLDLARATRGVVGACAAENALYRDEPPLRAPASDKRRALLRQALHQAASVEANPVARNALVREADVLIEQALVADPDARIPLLDHAKALADLLGLRLVMAKLSDEVLGMPPRVYVRDG